MKREILFRGLRLDGKGWVYGGFTFDAIGEPRITIKCGAGLEFIKVNPETVGQFTGLLDKNGVKIFEGDIVNHIGRSNIKGKVSFFEGSFIVGLAITSNSLINFNVPNYVEITSNIHES